MRDLTSVYVWGVGGALALDWLGTIYRQRTMPTLYTCIWFPTNAKPRPPPPTLGRSCTYISALHPMHLLQMQVYLIDKFSLYNLKMATHLFPKHVVVLYI